MKIFLVLLFATVAYEIIKWIYLNRKKVFPGMVKDSFASVLSDHYFSQIIKELEKRKKE